MSLNLVDRAMYLWENPWNPETIISKWVPPESLLFSRNKVRSGFLFRGNGQYFWRLTENDPHGGPYCGDTGIYRIEKPTALQDIIKGLVYENLKETLVLVRKI